MFQKRLFSAALTFGVAAALSLPVFAQDMDAAVQAIENALPGTLMHNPIEIDWDTRGNDKKIKVVDAATPTGKAISARVKKRKEKPWDIAMFVDMDKGLKAGDQVEMHFWARTAKAAKSKETAELIVFVGRNEEPYDYVISEEFAPDSEWKLHTLRGTATADFGKKRLKVEYQLAKHAQTVEFGPIYVSNLGPATD